MAEQVTIQRGRAIVHRSKNLRGLLDHARRAGPPVTVALKQARPMRDAQPFQMTVTYPDGTTGRAAWASWRVAADWVRARRAWAGVRVVNSCDGFALRVSGLAGAPTARDYAARPWARPHATDSNSPEPA